MMCRSHDAELEIQRLRQELLVTKAELQGRDQELSIYRAYNQCQLPASSPSNPDVLSADCNESFKLSNLPQQHNRVDAISRRNSVPRSAHSHQHGLAIPTRSCQSSNSRPHASTEPAHAPKRQRCISQQAPPQPSQSHQMNRSNSNLSSPSAGPFVGNGPITPLKPNTIMQNQSGSGMLDYMSEDEPVNAYACAHSMNRSPSARTRHRQNVINMPTVTESSGLLDPEEYFARQPQPDITLPDDGLSSSLPPYHHFHNLNIPHISGTSVCESMTSGQTLETAPMTRQNSAFDNQSVAGGVSMMSLGSFQGTDMLSGLDKPQLFNSSSRDNSPMGKHLPLNEDGLFAGVGASLTRFPNSEPFLTSHDMSRSASNASMQSNKSTSSLKVRAQETLKKQNQQSLKIKLQPKPLSESASPSQQPKNGNKTSDANKAAISKTKYVRPKQPKVFCNECKEHPDGFRGEHELRRHQASKHQTMVKKYICVHPSERQLPIGVQVVNPLDKCKACNQKKKYGAYYNAAAHLRRTHFKEKPSRGRSRVGNNGGVKEKTDEERRGGKGGGDWPPMSELKNWMMEVYVKKGEPSSPDCVDEDDDEIQDDLAAEQYPTDEDMLNFEIVDPGEFFIPDHAISTSMPPHRTHLSGEMLNIDTYSGFQPGSHPALAVNTDFNSLPLYEGGMPLSSASFGAFSDSMSPNFPAYQSHVQAYSSVGSDTVTPNTTTLNLWDGNDQLELNGHGDMGDMSFEMVYQQ